MKIIPMISLLVLPLVSIGAEVKIGDSFEAMRLAMGAPRGQVQLGGRDLFYYDRGEIELRSGVVTRVSLRSEEDQAALEAKRAADARRAQAEQEIRRARLLAEGDALKARKLADPSFLAAPLSYQVAFWEDFSRRYSDVPSAEQLQLARVRLADELAEQRVWTEQTRRLAELEARVIEAEALAKASTGRGFYPYYRSYRGNNPHPFASWPIEYHFYDSPLPYATSPGMPPNQPTYRKDTTLPKQDTFTSGRSDFRQRGERDSSDSRRFTRDYGRY